MGQIIGYVACWLPKGWFSRKLFLNEHWDGGLAKHLGGEKNKTKKPTKRTGSLAWCSKTLPENITGVSPFTIASRVRKTHGIDGRDRKKWLISVKEERERKGSIASSSHRDSAMYYYCAAWALCVFGRTFLSFWAEWWPVSTGRVRWWRRRRVNGSWPSSSQQIHSSSSSKKPKKQLLLPRKSFYFSQLLLISVRSVLYLGHERPRDVFLRLYH